LAAVRLGARPWLLVVLCAYGIEIALISFPVPTRFSLGWYAGRLYGFFSAVSC
jgi:hypothetical protein